MRIFIFLFIVTLPYFSWCQSRLKPIKGKDNKGNEKWGFINNKGKVKIPFQYDSVFFEFENGLAGVGKICSDTLKAGVIDEKGNIKTNFRYKTVLSDKGLLIAVDFKNFRQVLNPALDGFFKQYTWVDSLIYFYPYPVWYIYQKATLSDSVSADSVEFDTSSGHLVVYRDGVSFNRHCFFHHPGFDEKKTKAKVPTLVSALSVKDTGQYDKIFAPAEGFFKVEKKGYFGFIDSVGKIRISIQYQAAGDFSEGLAAVKLMDKWGFINSEEDLVVQPVFDSVFAFKEGTAVVKKDGSFNFINPLGAFKNSYSFDSVMYNEFGNWYLLKGGKWGLADSKGRELIIPKYSSLKDFGNNYASVSNYGLFGIFDYKQNIILPIRFNKIETPGGSIFFAEKKLPPGKYLIPLSNASK